MTDQNFRPMGSKELFMKCVHSGDHGREIPSQSPVPLPLVVEGAPVLVISSFSRNAERTLNNMIQHRLEESQINTDALGGLDTPIERELEDSPPRENEMEIVD